MLKKFQSIRQLQPSNFISNWNIPTDVALCHLMPQFLKLFSTLKGFLNLLVCPTYFSAVFFCSSSFGRAGKLYQFFQLSSTYLLQTKKLEIKGFFQGKVNWKSYPHSISIFPLYRDLKHSKIDHSFLQNVSLNSITLFVTTLFM